jgi:DNA-binding transcriptional MerR regulator
MYILDDDAPTPHVPVKEADMGHTKLYSVSDFAKLSKVSQVMLRHYEKLGLLTPAKRGGNNYRYYSIRQLSEVTLILTMQELGMSLREIKALKDRRTPERVVETLTLQIEKIDEKLRGWGSARRLISALLDPILSVRDVNEDSFTIQYLSAEPILLGDWNTYAGDEEGYDALVAFYNATRKKHPDMDINRPVWALFSPENVALKMNGGHTWPERYYFYTPEGHEVRPAGFYAIGYARGGYGQNNEIYGRLRDYMDNKGFEVCGNAYEEYPLNEICIADEDNYLMRVMIAVREKKPNHSKSGTANSAAARRNAK